MSVLTSIELKIEVVIHKSKDRVWDTLIKDIDQWWLADFHVLGDSQIMLEAKAGGRLYEKTESGAEGLWYTINNISPGQSLELVGHLRPEYGGPATSLLKLSLESSSDQTVLKISDSLFGALNEKTKNSISAGWKQLFEDGFKKYVENLSD